MPENSNVSLTSDVEISPNGSAWAALLAAGIGGAAFGIITDLSECCPRIAKLLRWYRPAGALSGVAISAILIWIIAWAALHACWKHQRIEKQLFLMTVTCLLALSALITTFPPFYEWFGG